MPTNSSLVAYLVIIFIQLSNAFSYEENQKSKSTDSKMSEYPPMHQTYCPQANIQQLTDDLSSNLGTISVEGIIMTNKCHNFLTISHKCKYPEVETPIVTKHKKIKAKIAGIKYECRFSYILGCESYIELLRHCLRYQGMPEKYIRMFQG